MIRYLLRLDDACPKRNIKNWDRIEALLDKYQVKPLVGIIPDCKDPDMDGYPEDPDFWTVRVPAWEKKGWTLAMHGYQHVFCTESGGVNPVNPQSEFAGLPLEEQREKIAVGVGILRECGINPKVFFAPAHTFDENTVKALLEETDIRIISDTPANRSYTRWGMTFVPQQSGRMRRLPFQTVTFCYHPNTLAETDFEDIRDFLSNHEFTDFPLNIEVRPPSIIDRTVILFYFAKKRFESRRKRKSDLCQ